MKVIVVPNKEEMGKVGGGIIAEHMLVKPHFVLGLATGSTPIPVYQELIRRHQEENLDFSTVITFNLDEYVGIGPDHDQSYRYFMNEQLFNHVNINSKATHVPDGLAEDVPAFCDRYEVWMDGVGGVDLQVLGIGGNGHIGFNEPGSSLASRTRQVQLTQETIQDNSRFFEKIEDVPTTAITMGIGTILESECILLFASGANKAEAVAASLEGPICAKVPASALQLHPNATFIVTEDAASKLTLTFS
jgi:glucosamine-6-phosphate deaminase